MKWLPGKVSKVNGPVSYQVLLEVMVENADVMLIS